MTIKNACCVWDVQKMTFLSKLWKITFEVHTFWFWWRVAKKKSEIKSAFWWNETPKPFNPHNDTKAEQLEQKMVKANPCKKQIRAVQPAQLEHKRPRQSSAKKRNRKKSWKKDKITRKQPLKSLNLLTKKRSSENHWERARRNAQPLLKKSFWMPEYQI